MVIDSGGSTGGSMFGSVDTASGGSAGPVVPLQLEKFDMFEQLHAEAVGYLKGTVGASVDVLFKTLKPKHDMVHKLMIRTKQLITNKNDYYCREISKVNDAIVNHQGIFGSREEDMFAFKAIELANYDELVQAKVLLECKMKAVNCMLVKKSEEYHAITELDRFFVEKYTAMMKNNM
jgi:hypothetical protein